ncbi:MAG: DoxX family membrane protein [Anaerolineaceae bacterium]|jgi:thiosulfate dehydrogenase [quinone] large subunit|nr:DoxX family membrane protein [Anaerolineaceae bacterium]
MSKSMNNSITMSDPPVANALFNNTKLAWIWLIVRVYLGYEWITAALHKLESAAWMQGGSALKGYWVNAVAVPDAPAKPVITYDWYRSFLQFLLDHNSYVWFAKLVAVGELLVGIALILGIFVGIAAFFGGLMNFNYMLAGTTSTNPMLFLLAVLLMLAWKTAGYWGLDRFALRWLGTPWKPGDIFHKKTESPQS